MTMFYAEVWLDEPDFCEHCPCLDPTGDDPHCRAGEFWMKRERMGSEGSYYFVTPRPKGCPLLDRNEVQN